MREIRLNILYGVGKLHDKWQRLIERKCRSKTTNAVDNSTHHLDSIVSHIETEVESVLITNMTAS